MNNLTKTLLCGVALCAFTAVPAVAESAGPSNVTVLHDGRVVTKTKMHRGATHMVSTFTAFAYESASTATVGTKYPVFELIVCNTTKPMKVKAPKKTVYGKISANTQTYSGCGHVNVGYTVIKQPGPNTNDTFSMVVKSEFVKDGTKYKLTTNANVDMMFQ
jgi:hypothetical protein